MCEKNNEESATQHNTTKKQIEVLCCMYSDPYYVGISKCIRIIYIWVVMRKKKTNNTFGFGANGDTACNHVEEE